MKINKIIYIPMSIELINGKYQDKLTTVKGIYRLTEYFEKEDLYTKNLENTYFYYYTFEFNFPGCVTYDKNKNNYYVLSIDTLYWYAQIL